MPNSASSSSVRATVVVIPRDSLSLTPDTVQRVLDVTQPIFKLMVYEGGATEAVRRRLRKVAAANPGRVEIVWSDAWIDPRAAVNEVIHRVTTEYTVFIENDVEVAQGWLEALVA